MADDSFGARLLVLWAALWQAPELEPPPSRVLNTEELLRERAHADAIADLDQPRPTPIDAAEAVRLLGDMPVFHELAWFATARIMRAAGAPHLWPTLSSALGTPADVKAQVWIDGFRLHLEVRGIAKKLQVTLDEQRAREGELRIHGQQGRYPYVLKLGPVWVHTQFTVPGASFRARYLLMLDAPTPDIDGVAAWPSRDEVDTWHHEIRVPLHRVMDRAHKCYVDEGLLQLWATHRSADRMAEMLDQLEALATVLEAQPRSKEARLMSMLENDPMTTWRASAADALLKLVDDPDGAVLARVIGDPKPEVRVVGARHGRSLEPWVSLASDPAAHESLVSEALVRLEGSAQLADAVSLGVSRGLEYNYPTDAWVFDSMVPFAEPEHEVALLVALQRAKAPVLVVLALGEVASVSAVPALLALKGRWDAPHAIACIQARAQGAAGAVSLAPDVGGGLGLVDD